MIDRDTILQRIWAIAEPVAMAAGLELIDVQLPTERGRHLVRLLLDRPGGGVTLDELSAVSREVGQLFDVHEAIPWRYHLECSSPGVERPLIRAAHYARAVGERVTVRLREAREGRRRYRGVLEAVLEDEGPQVRDDEVGVVVVPFALIERANVEFDFAAALRGRRAHG